MPTHTHILDCIGGKIEKTTFSKTEKPLIDFLGQRQNLSLKTTQIKTIEKVEQMFFDLQKIKTKQNTTSTSTANAISKKREEVFFFFFFSPNIHILTLHPLLLILKNLRPWINLFLNYLKLKRFVGKPNPMSFTKKLVFKAYPFWYAIWRKIFNLLLLINFMNGILMVYLNKKLLISYVYGC